MTNLNASEPACPMTAPVDAKTQEGVVLAAGMAFVPASAVCVDDRVRTLYGYLSVTFAHSEGVSVCLHLTMPDGDTLIYHVDPSKEFEVIRDETD